MEKGREKDILTLFSATCVMDFIFTHHFENLIKSCLLLHNSTFLK